MLIAEAILKPRRHTLVIKWDNNIKQNIPLNYLQKKANNYYKISGFKIIDLVKIKIFFANGYELIIEPIQLI